MAEQDGFSLSRRFIDELRKMLAWWKQQTSAGGGTSARGRRGQVVPYMFRRFELKDPLTPGGTATAYRLRWDDYSSGYVPNANIEFEVTDYRGLYSGSSGAWGLAIKHHDRDIWEVVDIQVELQTHWFKAQAKWESNSGDNRVSCKQCDRDGTNVQASTVWVYLPRNADCDPTVFTDDVIGATMSDGGVLTCVTCYGDGSKIGDIRLTSLTANIRPGWREANGVSSAWDAKDRFIIGRGSDNVVGAEGGLKTASAHTHDMAEASQGAFDLIDGINAGTDDFSSGPLTATTSTVSSHAHTFDVDASEMCKIGDATDSQGGHDNRPEYKTHIVIERWE